MRKKIIILGSTGSIGLSALSVVNDMPDKFKIVGLGAGKNYKLLAEQAKKFEVKDVVIFDERNISSLKKELPNAKVYGGERGLSDLVSENEADILLVAIVGTKGLLPTLAGIRTKKTIALASKEVLVMAGEIVMSEAKKNKVKILPVDSEHNAIFQCLHGEKKEEINKLILTASGGPFRTLPKEKFDQITISDALKHPTWEMGKKITIDSATMFNKALELIEARWLFNIEDKNIDVIVHRESIIHSMVEFCDGSIIAQMSVSDMKYPIQYAFTYPNRIENDFKKLNLAEIASLHFEELRYEIFPAITYARRALDIGAGGCAVLNASNEIAVDLFLNEKINFLDISKIVNKSLDKFDFKCKYMSLDDIIALDLETRNFLYRENYDN